MEHCDLFVAIHIAVEQDAPAPRVLQAAWPDVQLIHRVADLSNDTLPQIVEKATYVRTWVVRGPAYHPSHLLAACSEIPRLVSSLQKLVPDAQVAFMAECVSALTWIFGIAFRVL